MLRWSRRRSRATPGSWRGEPRWLLRRLSRSLGGCSIAASCTVCGTSGSGGTWAGGGRGRGLDRRCIGRLRTLARWWPVRIRRGSILRMGRLRPIVRMGRLRPIVRMGRLRTVRHTHTVGALLSHPHHLAHPELLSHPHHLTHAWLSHPHHLTHAWLSHPHLTHIGLSHQAHAKGVGVEGAGSLGGGGG